MTDQEGDDCHQEEVEEVEPGGPFALATLQRHVEILGEALILGAEPLELPLQREL